MAIYNFTREQLEQLGFKLASSKSHGDFVDWFILHINDFEIWIQMNGNCEVHEYYNKNQIELPTMTIEKLELLIKSLS